MDHAAVQPVSMLDQDIARSKHSRCRITFEIDQSADSPGKATASTHSTGLTFNRHSGVAVSAYTAFEDQSQP